MASPPEPPVPSDRFLPQVEGLRAVGILLVVLFHVGLPGFTGGFVGVDVLFVVSGYIITRLLLAGREATGGVNFVDFYARRARRLVPAGLAMILATALLSRALPVGARHEDLGPASVAAVAYLSNLHFIAASFDYFDAQVARNPMLHTWSLGVEAQFYLIWPLLIAYGPRRRWAMALVLGVVTAASLAASVILTPGNPQQAFFGLPTRVWELGAGGLLALVPAGGARRAGGAIALAGLAMLLLSALLIGPQTPFPGWVAIAPVAGAAAVIFGASEGGWAQRLLGWAPLQAVGRVSYGWYLWHWPLLILSTAMWPAGGLALRVAAVVVAFGLAVLSYRFLETPIRRARALVARPGLTLALAGVAAAATAGGAWLLSLRA